jgi:DNA-binding SARP family transcriptional activator
VSPGRHVRCGAAGTFPAPRLIRSVARAAAPRYGRSTTGLDFCLLGPLQVAANGKLLPLGGAKQRAVLALLLLHANEVVATDRLIDELWGESPPESAANMLQGYVSHLRKTLEPGRRRGEHELLVSRPPGYVLQVAPEHVDAVRFEQLVREARALLAEGDPATAVAGFRAALELWRGPALADLAYEPFATAHAERLEELRLAAVEDRIEAELQQGRHDALVGELRALTAEHPLRERPRAQLMAALYRCGRQAEALDVYRDGRRVLSDELGIEPGPTLRAVERAILLQDPALGKPDPLPLAAVRSIRRSRPLTAAAAVAAVVALAGGVAFGRSDAAHPLVVRPHSVAVVDPRKNAAVDDIPVGSYPGPLATDDQFVYVANIGDATFSRILPATKKVYDTGSLSRAIDLAVVDNHLWAANGGAAGHTLAPPGTVLDYDLSDAHMQTIPLGPSVDGDEEQTTIGAGGGAVWGGNKDSATITELEPPSSAKVHGVAPGGLAVVPAPHGDTTVWASDPARNRVLRIDSASRRLVARVRVEGAPSRLAASPRAVWVIARGYGVTQWKPTRETRPAVWRIDPATNSVVRRIPLPLTPLRIAIGAGSVWVTAQRVESSSGQSSDATVFRIDPVTNRIVARIPLHTRAVDGIVVSHGLVWVAIPQSQ